MARQTMKRKTSIAPCYSETDGTLLSLERSREAACPSLRLLHVLTTHSSVADSNIGIIVRSANNNVGTEQPSGLGHKKRKDVSRHFMKPLCAGESSASRSRLFTFCEKSICSHLIAGWVAPQTIWTLRKIEIFFCICLESKQD
jgi:hypothetical protein